MKSSDKDPWAHFSNAFAHFERGWQSADEGFAAAEVKQYSGREARLLIATTWRSRWKLFCVFNRIAWRLLLRGRCTVKL